MGHHVDKLKLIYGIFLIPLFFVLFVLLLLIQGVLFDVSLLELPDSLQLLVELLSLQGVFAVIIILRMYFSLHSQSHPLVVVIGDRRR